MADLKQTREALENGLEEAFLEVKEILGEPFYQRWRTDIDQRLEGLPVLIPMLTDCIRKEGNKMRDDESYRQEIYDLYR